MRSHPITASVTARLFLSLTVYALLASITHAAVTPQAQTCSATDSRSTCSPTTSSTSWFPSIPTTIRYEGPQSTNPLAFKHYNASEIIMGKTMKDWLRFSMAFWHTMRGDGGDPFGGPTKAWPWEDPALDEMKMAHRRLDVFFEMLDKLDVEYWCFHDRDVGPEMPTLEESNAALDVLAEHAARLQKEHDVKLLWGTSQLFKDRRYMNGAATSPNATVFAWAAAQAKHAMEVTHRLGGKAFTFWGGREGYSSLLNTNMKLVRNDRVFQHVF
jgi:xylose isomerase